MQLHFCVTHKSLNVAEQKSFLLIQKSGTSI